MKSKRNILDKLQERFHRNEHQQQQFCCALCNTCTWFWGCPVTWRWTNNKPWVRPVTVSLSTGHIKNGITPVGNTANAQELQQLWSSQTLSQVQDITLTTHCHLILRQRLHGTQKLRFGSWPAYVVFSVPPTIITAHWPTMDSHDLSSGDTTKSWIRATVKISNKQLATMIKSHLQEHSRFTKSYQ